MKILIDGDACPVKETIYQVSAENDCEVILVTSLSHYSNKDLPEHVKVVYVDEGADSADYRLVALTKGDDILVTQDYGLASLVLPKGVRVLHHLGYEYTATTINQLLESRYLGEQMRKSGQRTKGPKKFTQENQKVFEQKLRELLV